MTALVMAAAGLWLTGALSKRVTPDPFIRITLISSYLLKVGLTFALFYISLWKFPFMASHQLGSGLWTFSWDAATYDLYGRQVAQALLSGKPLPVLNQEWPFDLYTGLIYALFGPSPLHAALLNAWYGTLAGIVAILLIKKSTPDVRNLRIGIGLICLWPSSFLWSSQMLKESLIILLLLTVFYLFVLLWEGESRLSFRSGFLWISIGFVLFILMFLRIYLGLILAVCGSMMLGIEGVRAARRRNLDNSIKAAGLAAVLLLAILWGDYAILPKVFAGSHSGFVGTIEHRLPEYLGLIRDGMIREKGQATLDLNVHVRTWVEIIRYLPRGLSIFFLSPFPCDWLGSFQRGALQLFAVAEVILIYLLLPFYAIAAAAGVRSRQVQNRLLVFCAVLLSALLCVTIPNVGTIFRLRLQVLTLLIVLAASTESFPAWGRTR